MAISFNQIQATLRVPIVAVEISNENAVQGSTIQPYKILVIGQRLPTGSVVAHVPTRITSVAQAKNFFGTGSMLAHMLEALIRVNNFTETWAIAVDDDAAAQAATCTITVVGAPTAGGTINMYVSGRRMTVGVNVSDDAEAIASNISTSINANADMPVTATSALGVVTLTSKNAGAAGNGIDIRFNFHTGEEFPSGVRATATTFSGGTSNPDLAAAIAALGDQQYHVIALPYTDAVSLSTIEAELSDRWGPMRMIEGMAFAASRENHSGLGTLGNSRNSPHVSIMGAYGIPNAPWEVAAAVAGTVAFYSNIDPARQFKTLPLTGILPPASGDRFTMQERNILLYDGISTFVVDAGGVVRLERIITTYKTNPAGADDPSYLDAMTPMLLCFLRWDFRNHILRKYPRHKLANDGTRYGVGQAIITPKIGKAEAVAKFRDWEDMGLVENGEQFKRDLICERNATDPNRLDWLLSPDIINNFMVGAAKIAFLLQGAERPS